MGLCGAGSMTCRTGRIPIAAVAERMLRDLPTLLCTPGQPKSL
jgi:hypothetical protein